MVFDWQSYGLEAQNHLAARICAIYSSFLESVHRAGSFSFLIPYLMGTSPANCAGYLWRCLSKDQKLRRASGRQGLSKLRARGTLISFVDIALAAKLGTEGAAVFRRAKHR